MAKETFRLTIVLEIECDDRSDAAEAVDATLDAGVLQDAVNAHHESTSTPPVRVVSAVLQ